MHHIINLGAGVQSSTMALMATHGEVEPMPEFAVFADTQAEPKAVYEWLDWLEKQLAFPVYRVTAGDLRHYALLKKTTKDGRTFATTAIPVYTLNEDYSDGKIPYRTCTRDFKIRPIHKFIRKQFKIKRGAVDVVTQWLGISLDEMKRMKPSRDRWSVHRWPLIEKRMSRHNCLDWMRKHGYPKPPRSACTFCPFHSDEEWRTLQRSGEFDSAVEFEQKLQQIKSESSNFVSVPFLNNRRVPLDQIDFRTDREKGQRMLWDDECEGMCGL